jgi:hypothetical protein
LKYVRRWFERLVPILAKRQVTRGGPVILVQQENEYHYANRPDGHAYQATLVRWLRELGIEATISDCSLSDARIEGSLQTINGFNVSVLRTPSVQPPARRIACGDVRSLSTAGPSRPWGSTRPPG